MRKSDSVCLRENFTTRDKGLFMLATTTEEPFTAAHRAFSNARTEVRAKTSRQPPWPPRMQFVTTKDLIAIGRNAVNIRAGAVGIMDNQMGTLSFRHRDICGPAFLKTYVFSKDEFMDAAGDRIEIEEVT